MVNRFKFVVPVLHHPVQGNIPGESAPDIQSHFLCMYKCNKFTPKHMQYLEDATECVQDEMAKLKRKYEFAISPRVHSIGNPDLSLYVPKYIRNYFEVMSSALCSPQIGEVIKLKTGEKVVVLKTTWLRLVQRRWRNVMHMRHKIERMRAHPESILVREKTGLWPSECRVLPSLNGMLSHINPDNTLIQNRTLL